MPTDRPALGDAGLRRRGGGAAGGGAEDLAGRRAAAVPARAVAIRSWRIASCNPSLDHLHDPMRLADMGVAVDRILGGDRAQGADRHPRRLRRRRHHLDGDPAPRARAARRRRDRISSPSGCKDGYGLQPVAIERLHADGVALIDLGGLRHPRRRGGAARARARRRSDHHRPPRAGHRAAAGARGDQPEAARLQLSGQVPRRRRRRAEAGAGALPHAPAATSWLPGFIKVAAIGTLADVVPLVGENRVIAKLGLELLTKGPHKVGLRALLDVCGLTGKTIDSYHIGFMLAPRVNAAGRMSTPDIADAAAPGRRRGDGRGSARSWRCSSMARTSGGRKRKPRSSRAAKKIVQTDPEVGARIDPRRRRRRLAPRRHRHRRLEAGGRVSPAGDRAVDRGRRRPRLVPQLLALRHARRARALRAPADPVRRPQAGGRPDAWRRRGSGSCGWRSTTSPTRRSGPTI